MTKQNLLARNCINTSRQLVEHRGFEPLTSSLRTMRATNCANAPQLIHINTGSAKAENGITLP